MLVLKSQDPCRSIGMNRESCFWADQFRAARPAHRVAVWYCPADLRWGVPLKRRAIRRRSLREHVGKMTPRENGGLWPSQERKSAGESGLSALSENVSPGKYVVFSRVPRSPASSRDCVAVPAVCCEPVSLSIFPGYRESTGNFLQTASISNRLRSNSQLLQEVSWKIP